MDKRERPKGWWCCGLHRGPAEMQCPFCRKVQPGLRIPENAILLKPRGEKHERRR
jgi:hypothetical protein